MSDSKVLIVGDMHFGMRGANTIFQTEIEKFCSEVLLPTIDEVKPNAIVMLGDLFDDRTRIHTRTSNSVRDSFVDPLEERQIPTFVIIGNHDTLTRDSIRPNSVGPFLKGCRHIHVIEEPTDLKVGSLEMLLVPWICKNNEEAVIEAMSKTPATYALGHFELEGFEVSPGQVFTEKTPVMSVLHRFEKILSGHFHLFSQKGNVLYVGSVHQMSRSDQDQLKRIWVLDTEDLTLEPIVNRSRLFVTVKVSADKVEGKTYDEWSQDAGLYCNKIVTVLVEEGVEDVLVDRVFVALDDGGAADIKVADSRTSLSEIDELDAAEVQAMSTEEIIFRHIDASTYAEGVEKERLKKIVAEVLGEARGVSRGEF